MNMQTQLNEIYYVYPSLRPVSRFCLIISQAQRMTTIFVEVESTDSLDLDLHQYTRNNWFAVG